jgi:hypothetical protein
MRIKKIEQNTRDFNITDAIVDGGTDLNEATFNQMQDNIEEEFNKIPMRILSNGTNIDDLKTNGIYGILNATGTLPSVFTSDNNIFIHNYIWGTDWGRQILYDVRANNTFSRQLANGTWSGWRKVTQTDM